jgi:hypothetical protein
MRSVNGNVFDVSGKGSGPAVDRPTIGQVADLILDYDRIDIHEWAERAHALLVALRDEHRKGKNNGN